ncbi:DUF3316 domain-containing protein [Vibrio parahaemolyticus]|uniref:DUF3316 domain-containing protein n=1 Tax=Vibrio natriegens TaxID=691 RepID=UPI001594562F|nr:DUF3316 domain-containing protein [Vibrio natriegens]NVC95911.1 DUF3316 domain-containing protein [Vibrio natriegens]WMN88470.1 DUF3316 domain-containing protein [Vibrio parahaemolyticus]
MKALITILCMFFAFTATAGERMVQNNKKLYSDTFASKEEAINAGFNMYDSLASANDNQLRWKLNPTGQTVVGSSMNVESAQVMVEEVPVSRGTILYRAVVDVDFNYRVREGSR